MLRQMAWIAAILIGGAAAAAGALSWMFGEDLRPGECRRGDSAELIVSVATADWMTVPPVSVSGTQFQEVPSARHGCAVQLVFEADDPVRVNAQLAERLATAGFDVVDLQAAAPLDGGSIDQGDYAAWWSTRVGSSDIRVSVRLLDDAAIDVIAPLLEAVDVGADGEQLNNAPLCRPEDASFVQFTEADGGGVLLADRSSAVKRALEDVVDAQLDVAADATLLDTATGAAIGQAFITRSGYAPQPWALTSVYWCAGASP